MNKKGPLWKSFYYAFCGIVGNIIKERNNNKKLTLKNFFIILCCLLVL